MGRRFNIEFSQAAKREFEELRIFDQRQVLDAIERNLISEPNVETRNKKYLGTEPANFDYQPPLWELKIAMFRAFYDVDADEVVVYIRAVRRKPAHRTTAEVLNEATGN